jgi:hypothetical protein
MVFQSTTSGGIRLCIFDFGEVKRKSALTDTKRETILSYSIKRLYVIRRLIVNAKMHGLIPDALA